MDDDSGYALGFSAAEQQRLVLQHRLFGGFTRALLHDAGIAPGMQVLDVGAGVGDVSLLAAACVGAEGTVVGVERSAAYVEAARRRVAGLGHVEFVEGDLFEVVPARKFDLIVGRFVLEWVPDPVAALRHLAGYLRPGGVMVFQDYDHPLVEGQYSLPVAPLFEAVLSGCIDALARGGLERRMGAMLRRSFVAAGLPAPQLRVDVAMGGGADYPAYGWLAAGATSLWPLLKDSPLAQQLGPLDELEARLRDDVCARDSVVRLAPIVGAWARVG